MFHGGGCERADSCVMDPTCDVYGNCVLVEAGRESEEGTDDGCADPV